MIPAKKLFTRPRLSRLRQAGLLPAPTLVNGIACYSQDALDRCEQLIAAGSDRWIMVHHGRGRPSLAEIGELAKEAA